MSIKVTALPAALGATVEGLDADHLDDGVSAELREAFWAHKVLFFPQVHLTDEQHVALGSLFGDLEAVSNDDTDHRDHHTVDDEGKILVLDSSNEYSRANFWHTDVTFARQPPLGSLLSMKESPPSGGDTMWANTQAAYEGLSDPIKAALEGVIARHGRVGLTDLTDHPAITIHPETGERILFVNRGWTSSLTGNEPLGEQVPVGAAVRSHGAARIRCEMAMERRRRCLVGQPLHHALRHRRLRRRPPAHSSGHHLRPLWRRSGSGRARGLARAPKGPVRPPRSARGGCRAGLEPSRPR